MPNHDAHRFIVIMAGGSGTRLWPLSRRTKPKQFQKLISDKTLLRETFERALRVVSTEQIFVSTTRAYATEVLQELPEISQNQLILEPEARNTAAAIGLVATCLLARDPEALVATIASDHAIHNPEMFVSALESAFSAVTARPEALATVGINPTKPDTGLGYIKMGQEQGVASGARIFSVEEFKEKPDRETAESYIADWRYLWNAGYFIFFAKTFALWTKNFAPDLAQTLQAIVALPEDASEKILTLYKTLPKEAIEPLIIERLSENERLVIPSALRWSDVGNWNTLHEFLKAEKNLSVILPKGAVDLGSENILVQSNKKIVATLGLKDVVIIDTPDALLIADKHLSESEMKKLLEKIEEERPGEFL